MSRTLSRPHGFSQTIMPYGEIVLMNLYTCCHCQFTWEAATGSVGGELAGGFCGKCFGYICKNPDCLRECRPWEQRLENREAGRHYLAGRLVSVSIPDMSALAQPIKEAHETKMRLGVAGETPKWTPPAKPKKRESGLILA